MGRPHLVLSDKRSVISYTIGVREIGMPHPSNKSRKTTGSETTADAQRPLPTATEGKNLAAQILGQLGGLKRASTMSPERRSEIARIAARSRWDKASDA